MQIKRKNKMLNLKRISIFLIFVMLAFSINTSFSQEKDKKFDPVTKANKVSEKIQKKLSLSQDKTTEVNQAFLNYYTSMQNFRTTKSDDKEKNMAAMKEIRNSLKTDLTKTLDEKQMEQVKKFMNHGKHKKSDKNYEQK